MVDLQLSLTNEQAKAARYELRRFKEHLTSKMAGEKSDNKDTATPAFVVCERILHALEGGRGNGKPPHGERA